MSPEEIFDHVENQFPSPKQDDPIKDWGEFEKIVKLLLLKGVSNEEIKIIVLWIEDYARAKSTKAALQALEDIKLPVHNL